MLSICSSVIADYDCDLMSDCKTLSGIYNVNRHLYANLKHNELRYLCHISNDYC